MNALQQLRRRLQELPLRTMVVTAVKEAVPQLEDLNVEQLKQGLRTDDTSISPAYRNPLYAQYKNYRNPKPGLGNPDLINEGDFARSITAEVTEEEIYLYATDPKTEALEIKYGAVVGLTDAHIKKVQEDIVLPSILPDVLHYLLK